MSERRRLRVLLVSGSLPPVRCGVGDYTAGLARALAETGRMEVAVLTSRLEGGRGPVPATGFEVLEPIHNWSMTSLRPALETLRSWKPDVVHVQHPSQGYDGTLPLVLGLAARWRLGLPLVLTLHEPVGVNRQVFAMAALIRSAGAVVVVRHNFRSLTHPRVRWTIAAKELRFIPNATTLPRVDRTPERLRAVRERYHAGAKPIVAYFGFIYASRGVHLLFQIADPARHCVVIVGGRLEEAATYHDAIVALARQPAWMDACTLTGFLPAEQAAEVLACADAVALPFTEGGGSWNTSIHGARLQGTFVLATSREARGYDAEQNVYYAAPGDVGEMRAALNRYMGVRTPVRGVPTWDSVAAEHLDVYAGLRARPGA
jgi:glycosyltransferase involved in cell wall biosynthesis